MTGVLWAALGALATVIMAALGGMASQEIRDRLDHLPHAILRLAARRLATGQRITVYEDEWLPELSYILKEAEGRPITRLITSMQYATGLFISAARVARHLHREPLKASHLKDPETATSPPDPAGLLSLALSRPQDALLAARSLLTGEPSAYDASVAHHAIGIILRDRGDLPGAINQLKKGVRLARRSGRPAREIDMQATLGIALIWAGRRRQGLAVLDQAVEAAPSDMVGRLLMRRAAALKELGRLHEAHQDLSRALRHHRQAADTAWEARSLRMRADILLSLGLVDRAAADFTQAADLFAVIGQKHESALVRDSLQLLAQPASHHLETPA